MNQESKPATTIQFSVVPEFSWWRSKDNQRLLCVIEVHGRGQGSAYRSTEVAVVEVGIAYKKRIDYNQFVEQIRLGNLVQVHFFNTLPFVEEHIHRAKRFTA